MGSPRRASPERILAAAAAEFAGHGYAGARVDRIARRARVNKAMIYYHFRSKGELYRTLLRQTFRAAGDRLRAIAAADAEPGAKLDRAVAAIAAFVEEHQSFPAVMLREVAEGGARLDRASLEALAGLPAAIGAIVAQGVAAGVFRPTHPLAAYFSIAFPIVGYQAGAPIRRKLAARGLAPGPTLASGAFVAFMQDAARRALAPGPVPGDAAARPESEPS